MSAPKKGGDSSIVQWQINDCDEETSERCVESARGALKAFAGGDIKRFSDMAKIIHEAMAEVAGGGSWHTIVGKSYGSFVTHEVASTMSFSVGNVYFLVWRHG